MWSDKQPRYNIYWTDKRSGEECYEEGGLIWSAAVKEVDILKENDFFYNFRIIEREDSYGHNAES